ncbi:MAG: mandelate racemase/muconate lactonizing enzyme family protein [Caldilineaceae bacterium]|nr:mandelate racemase/muconate lactonizing enzyme family protein [Caldilineaceae bacterium]
MTKLSDVQVEALDVTFRNERLAVPLHLSRGSITEVTYAKVVVHVRTRAGQAQQGTGAIFLSDLWAFPDPTYDHSQKDRTMRTLCQTIGAYLQRGDSYSDPLEKGHQLEAALPDLVAQVEESLPFLQRGAIPYLAALNCLSPFDAAVHDAWGRALGGSAYAFYGETWLNADLGVYLGPAFQGCYPDAFLAKPRKTLRMQHVVGVSDALTPATAGPTPTGLPGDLTSWIQRDGLTCFKLKSRGQDPVVDAERLCEVYNTALAAGVSPGAIRLSLDPNEACSGPDFLVEMLARLAWDCPLGFAALDYIEQPTARDLSSYTFTLHKVALHKPVIIDESLDRLENLARLEPLGWSGLALKTCKGQSHTLLAYCWGKRHNLFMTLQDLTNPGLALVHSANLCAHVALSVDYFEGNSRQYTPAACLDEQAAYPAYFQLQDGSLHLPAQEPFGLY